MLVNSKIKPKHFFNDFVFKVSTIWKFDEFTLKIFKSGHLIQFLSDEESKEHIQFLENYKKVWLDTDQQIMTWYKTLTDLFIKYWCSIGWAFEKPKTKDIITSFAKGIFKTFILSDKKRIDLWKLDANNAS